MAATREESFPPFVRVRQDCATNGKVRQAQLELQFRQLVNCSAPIYQLELLKGRFTVRIKQTTAGEIKGLGTGSTVWHCAHAACMFLESEFGTDQGTQQLSNRRILELGSGTGIVGIVAALLGADVTLTDMPVMLDLLRENVESNVKSNYESYNSSVRADLISSRIRVKPLTWGENPLPISHDASPPSSSSEGLQPPYDLIIASDCIVDKFPLRKLLQTLKQLSEQQHSKSQVLLVVYEHRNQTSRQFFEWAQQEGFVFQRFFPRDFFVPDDIEMFRVVYMKSPGCT